MAWTETLRQASFRGVTFSVEAHELEGGKRVVAHQFPFRRGGVVEDLGPQLDSYEISGFLVGDDYPTRRDRLLAALAEPGPGELVHPYLGTKRVTVVRRRLVERASERRMCRIAITFLEEPDVAFPTIVADPVASTRMDASVLLADSGVAFDEDLAATLKPNAAKEGAAFGTERFCGDLAGWDLFGLPAKAAAWRRDVLELSETALELLGTPGAYLGALEAVFLDMAAAVGSQLALFELLLGLCAREAHRDRTFLSEGASADDGVDAFGALAARVAIGQAAAVAVEIDWGSYDAADNARGRILLLVDELAEDAPDDVYAALLALQGTLADSLPGPDANLPRISTVTLPRSTSALVLAYRLYDDVDRDADIVARNRVPNPCFLPSGVPLQILVDAEG